MAAWGRENNGCIPLGGLFKNYVGGNVAGVEGDNEVGSFVGFIFCYVAVNKLQTFKPQLFADVVAVFDNVLFKINAGH